MAWWECVCVFSVFLMECPCSVFYCHNWIHRWRTFDAILYREELTRLCRIKCSGTRDWCPRGNQITQNANPIVHLSSAGTPGPVLSSHLVSERRVRTEIWINLARRCLTLALLRLSWATRSNKCQIHASCFSLSQSQWVWGGNIGVMNKPWGLHPPFRESKDVFLSLLLFNFHFFKGAKKKKIWSTLKDYNGALEANLNVNQTCCYEHPNNQLEVQRHTDLRLNKELLTVPASLALSEEDGRVNAALHGGHPHSQLFFCSSFSALLFSSSKNFPQSYECPEKVAASLPLQL